MLQLTILRAPKWYWINPRPPGKTEERVRFHCWLPPGRCRPGAVSGHGVSGLLTSVQRLTTGHFYKEAPCSGHAAVTCHRQVGQGSAHCRPVISTESVLIRASIITATIGRTPPPAATQRLARTDSTQHLKTCVRHQIGSGSRMECLVWNRIGLISTGVLPSIWCLAQSKMNQSVLFMD